MFSMVHRLYILVCILLMQLFISYELFLKSSSKKLPIDQSQNFQVKHCQKRSLSSSEKQTPYRTLLQQPRVIKACEGFRAASSQKYKGNFNRLFSGYKLVQVHTFFSSGQTLPEELPALRSPMITCMITNPLSNNPKVRLFEESISLYKKLQKRPSSLKIFPPTSRKPVCFLGDLTPFGILQQIEHGEFLREVYSHRLKNTSPEKLFTIQTIPEKLQYQNSLAFAVGFLTQKQFSRIHVGKSLPDFASRSMNKHLNCPKLNMHSSQVENAINSGQFIFKEAHPSTKRLVSLFNSTDIIKSSSLEILQSTLSYLCNKISPVCHKDKPCIRITPKGLTETVRMTDSYFKNLIVNPLFTEISKLSTFPALQGIMESIHNSKIFFHTYSSKLSFLLYLLRTLGLTITERPVSVSHFIFEVYANSEGSKFFRILFNGEDLTNKVLSCKNTAASFSNLCPLSILNNFITHGIFEQFKSPTYTGACE
ncbi:Hypothetical predicted protein [Octopus vulgaris]|uniref:2-phosphoxylose phosphatase 1 n=1 Tax=Octopus vulgaris TaxID=6645 RepID=A0AA36AYG8_OCTVU|nr:Hypothetical predicted protein [Octopus vulgaris]